MVMWFSLSFTVICVFLFQAVVGLVSVVARLLSLVDVQTAVVARVQPFLIKPVLQLDREVSTECQISVPEICGYVIFMTNKACSYAGFMTHTNERLTCIK